MLSSDEEHSLKNVKLEQVIEECGSFGRYQFMHFFFLSLFPVAAGVVNFYYVFGVAEPPYECRVPNELNQSFRIEILSSQCSYVTKTYQNKTNGTYPCANWEYDRSLFGKTFTEEANFICQYGIYRSLATTLLQIGAMLIFFTGQVADRIGRRRALRLLIGLLLSTYLITHGLLQFVPMSTIQK